MENGLPGKARISCSTDLPERNGKVALLGYCLGALMVFMTAVRNDGIDAAVWYHGADTEKYLGEVDGLHAPILVLWPRRMSSFPRRHKQKLKQHSLRNQMRPCTATPGRVMPSPAITENTTTPPLLTLPTVGRANS